MPSRQRMLMAAVGLPVFGWMASAYGWMPHVAQKRWRMKCLLKRYVDAASSGVFSVNCSLGTNHRSEPFRWHIEQLHAIALSISPSTSYATLPQWQLPLYRIEHSD